MYIIFKEITSWHNVTETIDLKYLNKMLIVFNVDKLIYIKQ